MLLRSGAYLVHDDGFYRGISPLSRPGAAGEPFRSAMHAWARVVSRPEPGLALLDAGKRDVPFDEGLPEPQLAADQLGAPTRPLAGEITAVNDQHAFLRLDPADPLRVGQVVRLGLSHPCTAFDKWRWIPVVAAMTTVQPTRSSSSWSGRTSDAHPDPRRDRGRRHRDRALPRRRARRRRPDRGHRRPCRRSAGRRPRPRRRRAGARPRLHRHARPLRPGRAARPGARGQAHPGRDHRAARPGRAVLRPGRRRRAGHAPAQDRRLEHRPRPGTVQLAQRRRSTWTGSTHGIAGNAAYLVPHGVVRALVVGWDDVPATAADIAAMQEIVRTAMARGRGRAVGRAHLHPGHVRRQRRAARAADRRSASSAASSPRTTAPTARARWRRTRR